jgi:hypothetical protein
VPDTVAASVPAMVLPAKLTSAPAKPDTDSLKTTVKATEAALAGSVWPAA